VLETVQFNPPLIKVKVTGAKNLVCVSCLQVACLQLKGNLVIIKLVIMILVNEPATLYDHNCLHSLAFKFSSCLKIVCVVIVIDVAVIVFVVFVSVAFSHTSAYNARSLLHHAVCFCPTKLSLVLAPTH